jgi:GAF domain-containing protein
MRGEFGAGDAVAVRRWTAANFLLHGRYCERDVIAETLTRLRLETDSRAALLIPYRGQTLFHTLLLFSDANHSRGARRQEKLLDGERWRQPRGDPFRAYSEGLIDQEDLLRVLRKLPPFERIAGVLRGDIQVLSRSSEPLTTSIATPVPASIHVVLVAPKKQRAIAETEAALDDLLVMVNGSAAVVVHGNLEAEQNVDAALDRRDRKATADQDPALVDLSRTSLNRFAGELLQEALELTNSRLGNVYMAARDGEHLKLTAHRRNARPRKRIRIMDQDSVVSWVYRRKRPMVINNIPDFQRVHPQRQPLNVAGAYGTPQRELAVPIIQHTFSEGTDRVIGVVNVEKLSGGDEDDIDQVYSYRDVTVLRSVAHRVALRRASLMVDQASATLAGLMKKNTSAKEWREEEIDHSQFDARIPADAIAASQVVTEALGGVYRLTQSYSATVRLLSPDRRWLLRFAAYPPERMNDPRGAIKVDDRTSVTAWVARAGAICDLQHVHDKVERRKFKGLENWVNTGRGTKSELGVPIIVGGRVVGVLNLESRFHKGYAGSLGIAVAVGEQVGLAIQYARRFHEQTVISMSSATTANVHELGKLVDRLLTIAKDHEVETATQLRAIADAIADCSESGAALPERPPVKVSELVGQVLSDLELSAYFGIHNEPPVDLVYTGADALALRCALTALIENAYGNSPSEDRGCLIAWRSSSIGEKQYVTVLIANRIRLHPDAGDLRDLFRRPLRRDHSRVRLGAFTAGALVRSLGGDVFVQHGAPPYFIVGVDLPVEANGFGSEREEKE